MNLNFKTPAFSIVPKHITRLLCARSPAFTRRLENSNAQRNKFVSNRSTLKLSKRLTNDRGQSIIETSVGMIVLVVLALFMLDLSCVVLGKIQNDDIARRAARAAADYDLFPVAQQLDPKSAAQRVVGSYGQGHGFLSGVQLTPGFGDGGIQFRNLAKPANAPPDYNDHITISTTARVSLPCPMPVLGGSVVLVSQFTEPWVGTTYALRPIAQ